jgi:fatty acid desaturase
MWNRKDWRVIKLKSNYYARHAVALKKELQSAIDPQLLRKLHLKKPSRHFAVLLRQLLLFAVGIAGTVRLKDSAAWVLFAVITGWSVFNFTVLLHEVLHGLVFASRRPRWSRFLEFFYALPSGISPTQFTRWHLDHHAELGSNEGDPKRRFLSPRINRRWFKALYFTPALFVIYFRAAALETASYPGDVRRRIRKERAGAVAVQLAAALSAWHAGGWEICLKAYLVPVFLVFPVAFAVNRLGQHYDIQPEDPAQWSTLMRPSAFWSFAYLWSSFHLEHHYFPAVPFYNLPELHRALNPYFESKGMRARTYRYLLFQYLVLNKRPHTNWST